MSKIEPGDRIRYDVNPLPGSPRVWQQRREQDSLVMGVAEGWVYAWLIGDDFGAMFWSARPESVRVVARARYETADAEVSR